MKTEEPDRLDRWIPRAMVLAVLAVAVFAFVQSYTHGFYWGTTHHQTGTSLRMFPLIADWIMFAAALVRLHLKRKGVEHKGPFLALALGATVTLTINVAAGIIWGWETALTDSWAPVALFVTVELGMLLVRTAKAKPGKPEYVKALEERLGEFRFELNERDLRETQLSQPQPAPDPSPETATFPEAVDSPEPATQGWGLLAGQEPAGQPENMERRGLNGIGLKNRNS